MFSKTDIVLMGRCLELAARANNSVAPNPMVGAILAKSDLIISEGYHEVYGKGHAEVNALQNIHSTELLQKSVLYVSLEPCSHFGKTPPCADLIIEKKIPKVIIACPDPNPKVSGKGIEKLQKAGIDVSVGLLEKEAIELNKRFFTYQSQKRPYTILKWAETADGFIAQNDYSSKWISSSEARVLAHKWRTEEGAILVGYKTAFHDNPTLDSRLWTGKNPVRCLIDHDLKLPSHYNLLNGASKTIVFNRIKTAQENNIEYIKTENQSADDILANLYDSGISSLLVEGGATTHNLFLQAGKVDEIRQVKSKSLRFGNGISAVKVPEGFILTELLELEHEIIFTYRNIGIK